MFREIFAAVSLLAASGPVCAAEEQLPLSQLVAQIAGIPVVSTEPSAAKFVPDLVSLRGWEHTAGLFRKHGIDDQSILRLFGDPRMPERKALVFSLEPNESHYNYRRLNTKKNRAHARKFYDEHREYFRQAGERYHVPASVILAILQIETACGNNTGSSLVFPALVRLASAAAPDNLVANFENRRVTTDTPLARKIVRRALDLEQTFLPHAIAVLALAKAKGIDPFELRGSGAGAFGMPQFLPGHYFTYGADADGDGAVDLYSGPDAILSVANYLHAHGWQALQLPLSKRRAVIWEYNHSRPYVDTVLAMSARFEQELQASVPPATLPKKKNNT